MKTKNYLANAIDTAEMKATRLFGYDFFRGTEAIRKITEFRERLWDKDHRRNQGRSRTDVQFE